ncbi:hypothetical protein LA080_014516 [Diaporthe eres]|uniref:RlpA-like protein double-psi beta-barrel domain-containing protein n=1 Tax=Diaporthe vaccinii TaxID=105482 RepID=A0ABR4E286_9PEZI|nr:hypothetical protein LA080_014516 [Diaporthe eres]
MMLNAVALFSLVVAATAKVGEMTYYDPVTGNQVACGGYYTTNDRIAALGASDFDGRGVCGKTATVSYQGKTMAVTIVDRCEACKDGDIDVTPTAFQDLAPLPVGRVPACTHTAKILVARVVTKP